MTTLAEILAAQQKDKPSTLGVIFDAVAGLGGVQGGYAAAREAKRQQQLQNYSMLLQEAQINNSMKPKPQGVSLGDGGFGEYTPGTGLKVLRQPTPDEPPAVRLAKAAGLTPGTPEWKAALVPAIPGYGYTAPAIQAKTAGQVAVADHRAANSASLKAQPTYAQAHPKAAAGGKAGKPAKLPTGFILD